MFGIASAKYTPYMTPFLNRRNEALCYMLVCLASHPFSLFRSLLQKSARTWVSSVRKADCLFPRHNTSTSPCPHSAVSGKIRYTVPSVYKSPAKNMSKIESQSRNPRNLPCGLDPSTLYIIPQRLKFAFIATISCAVGGGRFPRLASSARTVGGGYHTTSPSPLPLFTRPTRKNRSVG